MQRSWLRGRIVCNDHGQISHPSYMARKMDFGTDRLSVHDSPGYRMRPFTSFSRYLIIGFTFSILLITTYFLSGRIPDTSRAFNDLPSILRKPSVDEWNPIFNATLGVGFSPPQTTRQTAD